MSEAIITVEHLSKRYRLGQIGASTLRESAERWLHRIRGRDPEQTMGEVGRGRTLDHRPETLDHGLGTGDHGPGSTGRASGIGDLGQEKASREPKNRSEVHGLGSKVCPVPGSKGSPSSDLWALRDVSFEVNQGEVLGIIGRNGAGKSTLLKILTRITEPTSGRAILRGRVASLLEVGTGFHPELSGRENIFLNGAILGMKRAEIAMKFDEIVAFAEVERFIDTPVKRYSSGMYVRLAFAVAAHLEPEILLVDEVLAVGDVEFQKKCLGKMGQVARTGRTILFVSHNLQAVQQLCTRCMTLHRGERLFLGSTSDAVSLYLGEGQRAFASAVDLDGYPRRHPLGLAQFNKVDFLDSDGNSVSRLKRSNELIVRATFTVSRPIERVNIHMAVMHAGGQCVFSESYSDAMERFDVAPGEYSVRFAIPTRFLKLESYFLVIALFGRREQCDLVEGIPMPMLVDETADEHAEVHRWGLVRVPVRWFPVAARSS